MNYHNDKLNISTRSNDVDADYVDAVHMSEEEIAKPEHACMDSFDKLAW